MFFYSEILTLLHLQILYISDCHTHLGKGAQNYSKGSGLLSRFITLNNCLPLSLPLLIPGILDVANTKQYIGTYVIPKGIAIME